MKYIRFAQTQQVLALFTLLILFQVFLLLTQSPAPPAAASALVPPPPSRASVLSAPRAEGNVFLPMVQGAVSPPKKGIGLTYSDCASATAVGAIWQFGWSPTPANCAGIENVPMIWGASDVNENLGGNSDWVLGFNEPDLQSNITPSQAATLWRQIEQKYPSRKLVAPAPSGANPTWVVSFYNAYVSAYGTAPRLDALAVHCYAWYASQCISHTQQFESWANSWGVPEVWVTEFSFSPTSPSSPSRALQEGQTFISWMMSDPKVTRYAWFASKMQGTEWWISGYFITPLIDWNSGQPTSFGNMYLPFR
jgi:hypothetical protein